MVKKTSMVQSFFIHPVLCIYF